MHTYTLSNKAKLDLIDIAKFTEKRWSKAQRNSYLQKIDSAFQLLRRTPLAGINCEFIRKGYRKFPIGSHVIYYRETPKNNLHFVRILHKRMDVDKTRV